ncbi:MAG TPA: hypothetical protein VMU81_20230 [Acetobacteraceae bacterium]|nr:hypothetical protein [Acetobacteraceae bacterium]
MRYVLWALVLLGGCGADPVTLTTVVMGTAAGSVAVMQRTPIDAAYSLATGKDCSVVRLDQGKSYCRPVEPPPSPQPYCTRSLGVTDCWADPAGEPPQQADGPNVLTPAQEANRTRRWPF